MPQQVGQRDAVVGEDLEVHLTVHVVQPFLGDEEPVFVQYHPAQVRVGVVRYPRLHVALVVTCVNTQGTETCLRITSLFFNHKTNNY